MEEYPEVPFIGLSATPFSKGLGNFYDNLIVPITAAELMDKGYLAPVKYYGGKRPDLKGVKTKKLQTGAMDYDPNALAKRMEEDSELVGDIVQNWLKYAENSQTVAFSPSILQSKALVNMFNKSGIPAEHIDGYMPDEERQILFREHDEGKFKVLSCSRLLNTGYDAPSVRCLIDAFPTKSITQYVQRVGRVLRLHEDKEFAIVLDHAGNVDKLGFAEDVVPEELDQGEKKYSERNQVKKDKKERDTMDCPMCYQIMKMPSCECGYEIPIKMIVESDNQILRELTRHTPEEIEAYEEEQRQEARRERAQKLREWQLKVAEQKRILEGERRREVAEFGQTKVSWLSQLQSYGQAKGYKPGWAYYKYKDKFGDWPTRADKTEANWSAEVTEEVRNYITHTIIKAAMDAKRNSRQAG
jgi:superfamily II DNA or RNA helicase